MVQASSGRSGRRWIAGIVEETVADEQTAVAVGALVDLIAVMKRAGQPQHGDSARGVLVHLAKHGALRGRDLSAQMHLDQSTVSRHLASLEVDGLIERTTDPTDGRAFVVSATPAGIAVARKMIGERVGEFVSLFADWTHADRVAFARLVGRLATELEALNALDPTHKEDNP